jgi:hypothetical protein
VEGSGFIPLIEVLFGTPMECAMQRSVLTGSCLPAVFDLLHRSLTRRSLRGVLWDCLGHLVELDGGPLAVREVIANCHTSLALEAEGASLPAQRLLDVLGTVEDLDQMLAAAAGRYVRATRFLLPWLHSFACAVADCAKGRPVLLFLRDGLAFWPALRALGQSTRWLFHTRARQRAGEPPLIQRGRLFDTATPADLDGALLVDVGLYGFLLAQMIQTGLCGGKPSVLFLGSRNPHIAGWLNIRLAPHLLGRPEHGRIIIRLVDTVEALLKPLHPTTQGSLQLRQADVLSCCCFAAFARASFRYSRRRGRKPASIVECLTALRAAHRDPEAWLLPSAVPTWPAGQEFLAHWSAGPLPPMDRLCGAAL